MNKLLKFYEINWKIVLNVSFVWIYIMIGSEKVREFKFRAKIHELGARIQSAGILIPREIYPARKLIPLRYYTS